MAAELTSALFTLGAACFAICLTVFQLLKEKVDKNVAEGTRLLLFTLYPKKMFKDMLRGVAQTAYITSFLEEVFRIAEARRRFRSLLLFLPIGGALFVVSGFLVILGDTSSEMIKPFLSAIGFSAYTMITGAMISLIYGSYQLVRLLRKLS